MFDRCLQNVKLDLELQTEKLYRLERELQDFSSVGNKDDNQVSVNVVSMYAHFTVYLSL